jgi:hypothetical protein
MRRKFSTPRRRSPVYTGRLALEFSVAASIS